MCHNLGNIMPKLKKMTKVPIFKKENKWCYIFSCDKTLLPPVVTVSNFGTTSGHFIFVTTSGILPAIVGHQKGYCYMVFCPPASKYYMDIT